jgi:hypothetical protein
MPERFRKYLPSSHFIKVFLICIVAAGVLFGTAKLIARARTHKLAVAEQAAQNTTYTGSLISISDLTEKDSDNDGIPDWEEALWGTDSTKADTNDDGKSDKEEIDAKKAELAKENPDTTTEALTDTQEFSHDLFASIAALKESGNLNDKSIQDLALTISENAGDKQVLVNAYTTANLKKSDDSPATIAAYQKAMVNVLASYDDSGIGTELSIINDSLSADTNDKLGDLPAIAKAYKDLAKALMAVSVPPSIASSHLALANSANNTGIALTTVSTIYDDSIGGLIGLSQYKSQSDTFDQTLTALHDYFVKNGIIQ